MTIGRIIIKIEGKHVYGRKHYQGWRQGNLQAAL